MSSNPITQLFNIKYPIIQAGMVWCAGWELASAVSNAGGLGIIGAGSMYPNVLETQLIKCREATNKPFGVNIPLMYPAISDHMQLLLKYKVPIVFTSAGNPRIWTKHLQAHGVIVVHVVSSTKFALKAQAAGVNAIVAEGFEAGGHNGKEETTTLCLVPAVKQAVKIPVIAAGGIATGRAMLAAMALGADAVQIGTRFVASEESCAHHNFKHTVVNATEGDTKLCLKKLVAVRLLKNAFYQKVAAAEAAGAENAELAQLLGRGRAKKGMFEGDLEEGELEIGQISAIINNIKPAAKIVHDIINEFNEAKSALLKIPKF